MQVDIYVRSATQDEDTDAKLAQQEADCRAYCAEHGLTVGLVMHEVASGWKYKGRPALDLIRSRCRNHVIGGVVVTYADRIVRRQVQLILFLKEIESHQAKLICTKEQFDETPNGKIIRMVLAFLEEMERADASR